MRIIKFGSNRCKPCQALKEFLPRWNINNLPIEEVLLQGEDYEANKELMQSYGIKFIPSMVVLDDKGDVLHTAIGTLSINHLFQTLNAN